MNYQEEVDLQAEKMLILKKWVVKFVFGLIILIVLLMGGCPQYNVWQQGLAGKAALKRAEQDRQIAIQEAQAKKESASMLADAEVIRAGGVAKANKIIAQGLGGPEGYLRYLWIDKMDNANMIYIPTEAGMPILEAGRLKGVIHE